jgi:membrane-associated phospholipid phosphatase
LTTGISSDTFPTALAPFAPRRSTAFHQAVTLVFPTPVGPSSLMEKPTPAFAEPEQTVPPHARLEDRFDRRAAIALAAIIVTYVVAIGYLAATGRFGFVWKTIIVPVLFLVALVTRRFTPFVKDWSVFLGAVVLFDCFRGLVFSLVLRFRFPFHAAYVVDWDKALLGGKTLPTILQDSLFSGRIGWFEKILVIIHGSHFVFFLLAGIAVWFFRRNEFWRFRRAFISLMVCGISAYFLVPTVPPWMAAAQYHLIPPIRHISFEVYNFAVPSLQRSFDTNPIGAMPSLHTAFPCLCTLVALHHFGRKAIPFAIYTLSVLFVIGYFGEHYLVDIIAGILLAGLIYLICYRVSSLSRRDEPVAVGWRSMAGTQAVIGVLLILASEGIGRAGMAMRRSHRRLDQRPFIEANLIGRSDVAHFLLAGIAMDDGDAPVAIRELEMASEELKDVGDRVRAKEMLEKIRAMNQPPLAEKQSDPLHP